jgi:hypothetical protein
LLLAIAVSSKRLSLAKAGAYPKGFNHGLSVGSLALPEFKKKVKNGAREKHPSLLRRNVCGHIRKGFIAQLKARNIDRREV